MRFQSSIRKKVSYGFYVCLGLIVLIALVNYFNLTVVDRKVAASMVVSELFDTTLEMRRFEKNYILYNTADDYAQNLLFTETAEDIINKNKEAFEGLAIEAYISALELAIRDYKSLMKRYFETDKTSDTVGAYVMEGKIRLKGREIVDKAERMSLTEREYIRSLIASSRKILIGSIFFLIIAGCAIGQYLSRMVVRPLEQIEGSMRKVAEGKFNILAVDSTDIEIISLYSAFRRMMSELELRQKSFILQSEKLISLGTMVSGVAHQLNNPLSNISTSCQILSEEIEEGDIGFKKELLGQIEEQVERAKGIIHSLLEFSKKKEFERVPLPLTDLIEDTLRLLRGEILTQVEVRVNIPDDLWLMADKQRIEQAILNIIKNGIDAIPGEGTILISAGETTPDKTVEIKIQDTGTGIEAEEMEKIFTPFFTTKAEGKGSGLGLFVAREIIEDHEGTIEVDSTPGQGTTFTIKLPLKETGP
ncbi:MAG: ATP-binding protein [Thermodesulfovibrionales bacterium]|nr:ATP-binding protein [Thermodesulfovibrionales bacterium]